MTTTDAVVPLAEIAGRAGVAMPTIIFHADAAKATVSERWDGVLVVPDSMARTILDRVRAEEAENDRKHAAHRATLADRERKRFEAGEAAVAKVRPQFLRRQQQEMLASGTTWDAGTITMSGQIPTPSTRAALAQVRREALERFDAKHPEVPFEKF